MERKHVGLFVFVLVLVSAGLVWAGGEKEKAGAAGVEKKNVTLWFPGNETMNKLAEIAPPLFNEQSEEYAIEFVLQPQDDAYRNLIRTSVAGGGGPDVVTTDGPAFTFELASAELLAPLDEYVAKHNWDELFVPWALNVGKMDGKVYGLPEEMETVILYYNKTLFEEHGWEPPDTINEMMALSEKIHNKGIIPFGHAYGECVPCNEWIVGQFLNHWAGPDMVYKALQGEVKWTHPDFVQAIEMLGEMPRKDWFMGGLDMFFSLGFDDMHAAFGNGEAAMNIEGTWFLSTIDNWFGESAGNDNDWNWVPVPTKSGEDLFDIGTGGTWSINAASKNPDGAAEFMNFWFRPNNQVTWLKEAGFQLAPINVTEEAFEGLDSRVADVFVTFSRASKGGSFGYTPWTHWPAKTDVYLYTEIQRVYSGQITAKEYLQGMQKVFDEELAAGEVPPIPAQD